MKILIALSIYIAVVIYATVHITQGFLRATKERREQVNQVLKLFEEGRK